MSAAKGLPLHEAQTKEEAQLLVDSVEPDKQRVFILAGDDNGDTALHAAAGQGKTGIVEYLCSIALPDSKIILEKNKVGCTALHLAETKQIAQVVVESVEPDKQGEFMLAANDDGCTALHAAVGENKTELVEYLCSIPLPDSKMILKKNKVGCTALHLAETKQIAQLLVESVEPDKQREFILAGGDGGHTALHVAAHLGKTEIVEYLCNIPLPDSELMLKEDNVGRTALHHAKTKQIAQLLVESVKPDRRRKFILSGDHDGRTALHIAAGKGKTNILVVGYLSNITPPDSVFMLKKDKIDCTALRYAETKQIAQQVIASVEPDKQGAFVRAGDNDDHAALHAAAELGKTEIVEYLCNIPLPDSELMLKEDNVGRTALHHAKTKQIAQLLVESVKPDRRRKFILSGDHDGRTALHIAAGQCKTEIVEYLCSIPLPDGELMLKKDKTECTALRFAETKQIAQLLVESVEPDKQREFIIAGDDDGHTALHFASGIGNAEMVEYLCSVSLHDSELMLQKNKVGRTALHHAKTQRIAHLLAESVEHDKKRKFIVADDNNDHTALHVAAGLGIAEIVEYLCSIPLPDSELMLKKDKVGRTALHHAKTKQIVKLLVESVEPDKQREFILASDDAGHTVLHVAVAQGKVEIVEYLCSILPPGSELVLKTDKIGRTALHHAKTKQIAKLLVESVETDKQREFILADDNPGHTALHVATGVGKVEIVEYLCSIPLPDSELVLKKDKGGLTALHNAETKQIAQILVKSLEPDKQREFILAGNDDDGFTALHIAAHQSKVEVVEYLSNILLPDSQLMLKKDKLGLTALHYAKTRQIAQLLVESLEPDKQRELILAGNDDDGCTALHVAAHQGTAEKVEYLCSIPLPGSELMLQKNKIDRTALHYAKTKQIAQLLVESVKPEKLREFILVGDNNDHTALHVHVAAGLGNAEIVEYLCNIPLPDSELMLKKDKVGHTALRHAKTKQIAQLLVESVEPDKRRQFILDADDDGRTALHAATGEGKTELVQYLCSIPLPESELMLKKNKVGCTALHLAEIKLIAQLLVESVEPDKQREFVLAGGVDGRSALHVAAHLGKTEIVEYLCSIPLPDSKLMLKKDNHGLSALHYAKTKQIAQLLVESVEPDKLREFILAGDGDGTALHSAAEVGKTEAVEYLCSIPLPDSELMLTKNKFGKTALHDAESKPIAQLLVESVEPDKRREFVLAGDNKGHTALHIAVGVGKIEIVEYLCGIPLPNSELVLKKDKVGLTALHYAETTKTAQLLVESVEPVKRRDLLLAGGDDDGHTALHVAAHLGKTEIVEYLCTIPLTDSGLMLKKNKDGRTALHYAKTKQIAQLLVESVQSNRQKDFLLTLDKNECTVLHYAAVQGNIELVEYLCSIPLPASEWFFWKSIEGDTALHSAATGEMVEILVDAMSPGELEQLLSVEDIHGNTVVLSLARLGRSGSLAHILDYIEQSDELESVLSTVLHHKNNYEQNLFHLAMQSLSMEDLYEVLLDYTQYMDMEAMMSQDVYDNTPLHYVAALKDSKVFADFVLRLPLFKRQNIISLKNNKNVDCRAIVKRQVFSESFYLEGVLCDTKITSYSKKFAEHGYFPSPDVKDKLDHPELYYRDDGRIINILKYALNEYSLLDRDYRTSHTLFSPALQTHITSMRGSVSSDHQALIGTTTIPAGTIDETRPAPCIFIDRDAVSEPRQRNVQRMLNDMNHPQHHGKPKIAVVVGKVTENNLNLAVPGPDYLLLTVDYKTSAYKSRQMLDMRKYRTADDLINEFRHDTDVEKVYINSSLNRMYLQDEIGLDQSGQSNIQAEVAADGGELGQDTLITSNKLGITGEKRGRALIICNDQTVYPWMNEKQRKTAEYRKEVRGIARVVFEQLLGLEVTVAHDLAADEMTSTISEFSRSEDHGSLVALAIFTHGYTLKRMISGTDGSNSECSVQEVVNALHGGNIDSIPKLLFLSFCRAEIEPRYNRVPYSFESTEIPWSEIDAGMNLQPVRLELPPAIREKVWKTEFPSLEVPLDCHICFTTLPDSQSRPTAFFKALYSHLSEISHAAATGQAFSSPAGDDAHGGQEILPQPRSDTYERVAMVKQDTDDTSTAMACQPVARVQLVALLTDVAGVLKEKTRSTQYANLCYTVNKNSKEIYIDILPWQQKTK